MIEIPYLSILNVFMLAYGLLAIASGQCHLWRGAPVYGKPARLLGAMLLCPLVIEWGLDYSLVGLQVAFKVSIPALVFEVKKAIQWLVPFGFGLSAVLLGTLWSADPRFSEPPEKRRARLLAEEILRHKESQRNLGASELFEK